MSDEYLQMENLDRSQIRTADNIDFLCLLSHQGELLL